MKRRQAVRNIALVSSGIVLLPGCNLELSQPDFDNIPLDNEQWQLLEHLTKAILPQRDLDVSTPETTVAFLLTMINDCFDPKDIQLYRTGLNVFVQFLKDKYNLSFKRLSPEQHLLIFSEIAQSDILPECLRFFLETTKQLTVRHFASSAYFMEHYQDFEFVPGRYLGCVRVEKE